MYMYLDVRGELVNRKRTLTHRLLTERCYRLIPNGIWLGWCSGKLLVWAYIRGLWGQAFVWWLWLRVWVSSVWCTGFPVTRPKFDSRQKHYHLISLYHVHKANVHSINTYLCTYTSHSLQILRKCQLSHFQQETMEVKTNHGGSAGSCRARRNKRTFYNTHYIKLYT